MPITTLNGCHLRPVMFGDMAKGGFVQQWRCVEHSRLERTVARRDRSSPTVTTWFVDGEACRDYAHAIERLNQPPGEGD